VISTTKSIILEAKGVSKSFGAMTAVNEVNFALKEHEVVAILGSNGAGKTTFFNLLTGLFAPSQGSIHYKGEEITSYSPAQRVAKGITRSFQLTSTFDTLSVIDNLVLAYYRSVNKGSLWSLFTTKTRSLQNSPAILQALETFELLEIQNRTVQSLSLGEKRRLEIAMAITASPEVLLLDEPLAGLAETEIKGVLSVLRKQFGKQTILIVEHKISHIQDFAERLVVMHEGRIIAEGGYEECMQHPEVRRSYWQIDDSISETSTGGGWGAHVLA
jgi:branched-chain amino acid transport system ATP-binding protein